MADLNTMTTKELEDLKKRNSANWTRDAAGAALHDQNVQIQKILDSRNGTSSSFDSGTGTWSSANDKSGANTQRTPTIAQQGSGGVGTNNFSGSAQATTPDGRSIVVSYLNGVMQDQDYVPDGTIVHALNGQDYRYNKTPEQQQNAALRKYMDLYNGQNSAYAQILEQQRAATKAATDRAVNSLNAQKDATADTYANYYRQAYIDRMNAQKNINQRMAAQGLTGGAAESTLLGMNTAYSDAARQLMEAEARDQAALDQAIVDARLSGDIEAANAAADTIKAQTDSYADVLANLINRYDTATARQTAYDREDAAIAREEAATKTAYARQIAMNMLQNGRMPDDDTLSAAGMTRAQATLLMPQVKSGTAGGSGTGSRYTKAQAETALAAAINGSSNDLTRAIVESYYGMPLETVLSAYGYGNQTPTGSGSAYDGVLADLEALRQNGASYATIKQVIDSARRDGIINNEQTQNLQIKYGLWGD